MRHCLQWDSPYLILLTEGHTPLSQLFKRELNLIKTLLAIVPDITLRGIHDPVDDGLNQLWEIVHGEGVVEEPVELVEDLD